MFRKNTCHYQLPLTSHVYELPEPLRKRLQESWAETFYQHFFCRLDEEPFAVLYADAPSRPNVPVNVLVGLEFLKAAHGWSDEEMYNQFCYNVQARYALGYRHLGEGYFDLRTLYNFRQRLAKHMQERGENLLEQAFEQITDEQMEAFALKTGQQRGDSTMRASNIRQMGRVQLLVTVLQRVHRMLSEEDRERYADLLAPYLKGHPGYYVYQLKKDKMPKHLQRIGEVIQQLPQVLEADYGQEPAYQVLARVFSEHFRQEPERLVVKEGSELSADSLQLPDDLEATYREKQRQGYWGYVVNVTETCDLENPAQLITKVQVAPNVTDDSTLLKEAIPGLKERTELDTLYTDGDYGSPESDTLLETHEVTLIQTVVRGRRRDPERLYLDDFQVEPQAGGEPQRVVCPQNVAAGVRRSRSGKPFGAEFDETQCAACPLQAQCPAKACKRKGGRLLQFTWQDLRRAERHRQARAHQKQGRNRRAAVEATVRSFKHPFAGGKAPVRGWFRVACMVIGVTAVVNIRGCTAHHPGQIQAQRSAGRARKGGEEGKPRAGRGSIFFCAPPLARLDRSSTRAASSSAPFLCLIKRSFCSGVMYVNEMIADLKKYAFSRTAHQTVGLYASQLTAIALGVVITSLNTRLLGPKDYGILAFFGTITGFSVLFFRFGLFSSGGLLLAYEKDVRAERELIGALVLIGLGVGLAFSAFIFVSSFFVDRIFQTNIDHLLRVLSPLLIAMPFQLLIPQIARGTNRISYLAWFNVLPKALYIVGLLMLLLLFRAKIEALILLNLTAILIAVAVIIWSFKPSFNNLRVNLRKIWVKNKEYGVHLYWGQIADQPTYRLDGVFISYFVDTTQLGFYSLANALTSPLAMLSQSLSTSMFKGFASKERIPKKVIQLNFLWLLTGVIGLVVLGKYIVIFLFSKRFLPVAPLILPLALAAFFRGMYQPYGMFSESKGKGLLIRKASIISSVVNLSSMTVLVPLLGAMGAAISLMLGRLAHLLVYLSYYYGVGRKGND